MYHAITIPALLLCSNLFVLLLTLVLERRCPRLDISACQMEAFRSFGIAGDEARCGVTNCSSTEAISLTSDICANQDDLPLNVLNNQHDEDLSFVERACCTASSAEASSGGLATLLPPVAPNDQCVALSLAKGQTSGPSMAAIIGGSVGVVLVVLGILCGLFYLRRRQSRLQKEKSNSTAAESSVPVASAKAVDGPVADGVVNLTVMSPSQVPSAPVAADDEHEIEF